MRTLVFIILFFNSATGLASYLSSIAIPIDGIDVIKKGSISISGHRYPIRVSELILSQKINETCGLESREINIFKNNLKNGSFENIVGCGIRNPKLVRLNSGINAVETYYVNAFAIDVIAFVKVLHFFTPDKYFRVLIFADDYQQEIIKEMADYFEKGEGNYMQWKSQNSADEFADAWSRSNGSIHLKNLDSAMDLVVKNIVFSRKLGL
jgi:hypothetical protein